MSESENFSDFEMSDRFILSSCEKTEVDVHETLSSVTSVQSSLIIMNRVWTTLRIRIIEFMMYVISWLTKQKNNEKIDAM